MKKVLLHPSYLPTVLQMAVVAQAEEVVFEVNDNYQKQTYRTRCFIAHSNGKLLLNVPVKQNQSSSRQKTKDVVVENDFKWQQQHWRSIQNAYRTSPFFEYYEDDLEPLFIEEVNSLLQFNLKIFETIAALIGIETESSFSTSYNITLNYSDFRFLIDAKKKSNYSLETYHQVFTESHGYLENLSVLDLLFNEGPNTLNYLESQQLDI